MKTNAHARTRVDDEVVTLRRLLFAQESDRIDAIEARLAENESEWRDLARRSEAHAEVLVDAVRLTANRDGQLSEALRPEVEKGLKQSIRDNPEVMADALYPVLGPAVRKLVASMFQPPASSGKSEVYQVEQVFLIHRETSLVLAHTALDERFANDADIVSGMLDAIRSFVQDAFEASDFDGMESLKVGDITVLVEWGPEAVLAAVVRGFAPDSLRETCAETLRRIHLEQAEAFTCFDGDTAPFEQLDTQLVEAARPATINRDGLLSKRGWIITALVLAAFGTVIGYAHSLSESRLYERVLRELNRTPGIVVVESHRNGSAAHVTALRDPLADAPEIWLNSRRFSDIDVEARWIPYLALEDAIVLKRVEAVLGPDTGMGIRVQDGIVTVAERSTDVLPSEVLTRLLTLPGVNDVQVAADDLNNDPEHEQALP